MAKKKKKAKTKKSARTTKVKAKGMGSIKTGASRQTTRKLARVKPTRSTKAAPTVAAPGGRRP
tara:strand:- start:222 stop:410 length:189 start_codon:yes stop_codon:yes gene_type:complete